MNEDRQIPLEGIDVGLYEAYVSFQEGRASADQLEALESRDWTVFHPKEHIYQILRFDQVKAGGLWHRLVNPPWQLGPPAFDPAPIPEFKRRKRERDRMAESMATAQRRASALVELRNQRQDEDWQELIYISRYLVAMSLPYEVTKERQITKSARLGDGRRAHLTLTAGLDGIDLPYGSDRTLLHWLLDQVARQLRESEGEPERMEQARFVRWSKASDYLKDMGLDAQGGKNYRDLRARYRRLSGLMIGVRIEGDGVERTKTMSIIEDAKLPSTIDIQAEAEGRRPLGLEGVDLTFGVYLSNKLVQTLMEAAVPFPKEILRKTRKQSQMQDYWLFLAWRSFAARKATLIPWAEVREQLWQHDQTARRIKTRFKEAITALRMVWPELNAEAREEGLRIGPPKGGVQLIGRGGELKRLGIEAEPPDFPAR